MKLQILPRAQAQVRSKRVWWVENRLLMPRTHSHVYFFLDERAGVVVVLAVWGAARGRGPLL